MSQDQQTFKRAAAAAMVGLAAQAALSLGVLVLAIWAISPAIAAVTWHYFGGLPIWIVLLMIFHQHRLERTEALETEQLASQDAAAAAIFDERAQDLHVARKRLERLYRWGLGGVSLLLAAYLMIVGLVLLSRNYGALKDETLWQHALAPYVGAPVLTVASLAMAMVAFLVARYVSGMTRVNEWQLLRGGASYMMGSALLALLIFAASAWTIIGEGQMPFVLLALAVPAIMALIGLEIAVTFLLSAYRPRRAGETPRPAFDSRLLGWTTSPESLGRIISDTLNYQFGFEISRSWFYRLLSRAMTPLIVLGLVSLLLVSSIVVVEPHEKAAIMRFGRITQIADPGIHLKLPWPISVVRKYEVDRVHQVIAGSTRTGVRHDARAILWTTSHVEDEQYLPTAPSRHRDVRHTLEGEAPAEEVEAVGVALLAAEAAVQYKIGDLSQYIAAVRTDQQMRQILTAIADRCVSELFVTHDIDTLLSGGRGDAGRRLRQAIQDHADRLQLGVEIIFVGLAGIHPPQKDNVAQSFHNQIAAYQEAQSAISNARKEAVQILTEAAGSREMAIRIDDAIGQVQSLKLQSASEGEIEAAERELRLLLESARGTVAQTIHQARSYRWQRELAAQADARAFLAAKAAYDRAPQYYMQRAYYDMLAEYMPKARQFVVDTTKLDIPPVYLLEFRETGNRGAGGLFEE